MRAFGSRAVSGVFELYSTRFGTATSNPDLDPERARISRSAGRTSDARRAPRSQSLYSDVRDLIQTVVLPDTTTQTQNVGTPFYGVEFAIAAPLGSD